ncbi:MAG: MgtC/SapB family protein [candidate division Zixibacteria bacterium]|nr:MgtC/SapB family protein [candidate division Zixibacteria bacterium]
MDVGLFKPLGLAFLLGLLVGMQRERNTDRIAGIRTFPLITLLGALSGILANVYGGWTVAVGWIGVAIVLYLGNLAELRLEKVYPGKTTEMAALVMYGVGAMLVAGYTEPAVALGGAVALTLYWKDPLHRLAARIDEADFNGVIQLVLIGLVILPVLHDRAFDPYKVLNPYRIWLMVVLIAGISLSGYVTYKLFGARRGVILGGLLGGLISSTANTVGYARQNRTRPETAWAAASICLLATVMMNIRVLIEIGVVAPRFFPMAAIPLGVVMGAMTALSVGAVYLMEPHPIDPPEHENPAQIKTALIFGLLYSVILFMVAAGKTHFGDQGLYTVAVLSGLTDMDAITLSTAEMVKLGRIDAHTGWRVILVASLSNLVFK